MKKSEAEALRTAIVAYQGCPGATVAVQRGRYGVVTEAHLKEVQAAAQAARVDTAIHMEGFSQKLVFMHGYPNRIAAFYY
jgi:hypothetical protein